MPTHAHTRAGMAERPASASGTKRWIDAREPVRDSPPRLVRTVGRSAESERNERRARGGGRRRMLFFCFASSPGAGAVPSAAGRPARMPLRPSSPAAAPPHPDPLVARRLAAARRAGTDRRTDAARPGGGTFPEPRATSRPGMSRAWSVTADRDRRCLQHTLQHRRSECVVLTRCGDSSARPACRPSPLWCGCMV